MEVEEVGAYSKLRDCWSMPRDVTGGLLEQTRSAATNYVGKQFYFGGFVVRVNKNCLYVSYFQ